MMARLLLNLVVLEILISFPAALSKSRDDNEQLNLTVFNKDFVFIDENFNDVVPIKFGRTIHKTAWSTEGKDTIQVQSGEKEDGNKVFSSWDVPKLLKLVMSVVHKLGKEDISVPSEASHDDIKAQTRKFTGNKNYATLPRNSKHSSGTKNQNKNDLKIINKILYAEKFEDLLKDYSSSYYEAEFGYDDSRFDDFSNLPRSAKLNSGNKRKENTRIHSKFETNLHHPFSDESKKQDSNKKLPSQLKEEHMGGHLNEEHLEDKINAVTINNNDKNGEKTLSAYTIANDTDFSLITIATKINESKSEPKIPNKKMTNTSIISKTVNLQTSENQMKDNKKSHKNYHKPKYTEPIEMRANNSVTKQPVKNGTIHTKKLEIAKSVFIAPISKKIRNSSNENVFRQVTIPQPNVFQKSTLQNVPKSYMQTLLNNIFKTSTNNEQNVLQNTRLKLAAETSLHTPNPLIEIFTRQSTNDDPFSLKENKSPSLNHILTGASGADQSSGYNQNILQETNLQVLTHPHIQNINTGKFTNKSPNSDQYILKESILLPPATSQTTYVENIPIQKIAIEKNTDKNVLINTNLQLTTLPTSLIHHLQNKTFLDGSKGKDEFFIKEPNFEYIKTFPLPFHNISNKDVMSKPTGNKEIILSDMSKPSTPVYGNDEKIINLHSYGISYVTNDELNLKNAKHKFGGSKESKKIEFPKKLNNENVTRNREFLTSKGFNSGDENTKHDIIKIIPNYDTSINSKGEKNKQIILQREILSNSRNAPMVINSSKPDIPLISHKDYETVSQYQSNNGVVQNISHFSDQNSEVVEKNQPLNDTSEDETSNKPYEIRTPGSLEDKNNVKTESEGDFDEYTSWSESFESKENFIHFNSEDDEDHQEKYNTEEVDSTPFDSSSFTSTSSLSSTVASSSAPNSDVIEEEEEDAKEETFDTILQLLYKHSNSPSIQSLREKLSDIQKT